MRSNSRRNVPCSFTFRGTLAPLSLSLPSTDEMAADSLNHFHRRATDAHRRVRALAGSLTRVNNGYTCPCLLDNFSNTLVYVATTSRASENPAREYLSLSIAVGREL